VTFEQLIVQQRPHIDQVVRDLSRRHFLAPAEIEEFGETVIRALERNDFELLRNFDGRSMWETYLTLVVTREFFLFQRELWGQWRPSASARRFGSAGVLLEELVVRDHVAVTEAADLMRAVHHVDLPRYRILEMAGHLRLDRGRAAVDPAAHIGAGEGGSSEFDNLVAFKCALDLLSPDDRLIVELRLHDRQPLKRIAKMLRIEMRPLQRRLDHAKNIVSESLLRQGVPRDDVNALLQYSDRDPAHTPQKSWQSRPSK
jgi:hypothetical protein